MNNKNNKNNKNDGSNNANNIHNVNSTKNSTYNSTDNSTDNALVKVIYNEEHPNERPTVLGRDLHKALEVSTEYRHWFPRMCEYGFAEGKDFKAVIFDRVQLEGARKVVREVTDHQLTIDMAKEICMIQRTEIGKRCREYFLEIEHQWNSPDAVMARALQMANRRMDMLRQQTLQLTETIAIKDQQIAEMKPKVSYYDIVLACKDLLPISQISKDYGWSARRMNEWLNEQRVQFKQGNIWLLYQKYAELGYTSTKTNLYSSKDGTQHTKIHTYWTQKGRLFIYEIMKAAGNLPLIELIERGN